jgi:uncharacterized spore protein YtfJ
MGPVPPPSRSGPPPSTTSRFATRTLRIPGTVPHPALTGRRARGSLDDVDLKHLMQELLEELGKVAKADAVVGGVRDAGRAKVLPLAKISVGFGTAMGSLDGKAKRGAEESDAGAQAGGAGGAVVIEPRAFVVVGEDGVPHMLALANGKQAVVRRGVRILPEASLTPALNGSETPRLGDGKS